MEDPILRPTTQTYFVFHPIHGSSVSVNPPLVPSVDVWVSCSVLQDPTVTRTSLTRDTTLVGHSRPAPNPHPHLGLHLDRPLTAEDSDRPLLRGLTFKLSIYYMFPGCTRGVG